MSDGVQGFRVPAQTTDGVFVEFVVAARDEDEAVDTVMDADDVVGLSRPGIETVDIYHDGEVPEVKHVH